MRYLLIILLAGLLSMVYRFDGKRISTPASLSVLVFLLSSIVFCINAEKWETWISLETVILIVSSLFVFWLGTRSKPKVRYRKEIRTEDNFNSSQQIYSINKSVILIFFGIGLIVDYFIYRRSIEILSNYFAAQYMLGALRSALSNEVSWGTGISMLREGYYAIGYSCIFAYCVNVCRNPRKNWKKWLYYLLPVIPMCIAMYLSTGRTGFIRVFGVAFVTCTTIINYDRKIKIGRFVKYGIIVFALLLIVFFELGKSTGKSQVFSAFDTLSIYIGSSIGALDGYLKNPTSYSRSIAGETLYGIRALLRIFNSNIVSTPIPLPFHMVAHGYNTNVYTALRRYINDYSVIGMYIIMYLKGVLFGNWENSLRRSKSLGFSLLLYSYLMYDIIMQSIEENFLRELLTVAQLFILVVFFVLYRYILKPSMKSIDD